MYDGVIVGGHDNRRSRLADVVQELYNLATGFGIQVARRLISQDQGRSIQDGSGDSDTLLLAT